MPNYVYMCPDGNTESVTHRMLYSTAVVCAGCGEDMWRVPQPFMVVWGGLKPSDGELGAGAKKMLDDAPRNRDELRKAHEEHERQTEND